MWTDLHECRRKCRFLPAFIDAVVFSSLLVLVKPILPGYLPLKVPSLFLKCLNLCSKVSSLTTNRQVHFFMMLDYVGHLQN